MRKSETLLGTKIPFVEASNVGSKQRPTAIVLRTSFTTSNSGSALGIAYAWHSPNNFDSCHYVIDEEKWYRCVPDKVSSTSSSTSKFNKRSITINLCYDPPEGPNDQIVYRTATQVARLCRLHRIKPRLLTKKQKIKWIEHPWRRRGGIILATVGDFPTNRFLDSVSQEYRKI